MNDIDLTEMSVAAMLMMEIDMFALFTNPLRTVYEETCTLKNVTYNWSDLNQLIYRGAMRTFVEGVNKQTEWIKEHPESK